MYCYTLKAACGIDIKNCIDLWFSTGEDSTAFSLNRYSTSEGVLWSPVLYIFGIPPVLTSEGISSVGVAIDVHVLNLGISTSKIGV